MEFRYSWPFACYSIFIRCDLRALTFNKIQEKIDKKKLNETLSKETFFYARQKQTAERKNEQKKWKEKDNQPTSKKYGNNSNKMVMLNVLW